MCKGIMRIGLEEVIPATFADVLPLLQCCHHEACIIWFCGKRKRSTRKKEHKDYVTKNGAFLVTIEIKTDVPFNFIFVSLLELQDLLLAIPTERVKVVAVKLLFVPLKFCLLENLHNESGMSKESVTFWSSSFCFAASWDSAYILLTCQNKWWNRKHQDQLKCTLFCFGKNKSIG